MPKIAYIALTRTGETVTGWIEAASRREALAQLRERALTPLDVSGGMVSVPLFRRRLSQAQAAQILRRLATVVARGGAPLTEVLPSLVDEEEVPPVKAVLVGVRDGVLRESLPISRALARYPEVFPRIVIGRIAAGEAAGSLAKALEDAALFLEQAVRTRSRIISALAYPCVISALALIIVTALSASIMPRFVAFYKQAGVPLPLFSRVVVGFGLALSHYWYVAIALIIAAVMGARRLLARQDVRDRLDYLRWNAPGWRRVERALAWSAWARAMAMLYSQGTEILQALQLACEAAGTAVLRDVAGLLVRRVAERAQIKRAMSEAGVFPPMMLTSIGVGEQHGTMQEMLQDAAAWYGREAELILEHLPNLLQPVAIVVVGTIVGVMVLAMYLPMFRMYGIINSLH